MADDDFNYDEIEERFRRAILKDKAEEANLRRKKKKKKIVFNPRPLLTLLLIVGAFFVVKGIVWRKGPGRAVKPEITAAVAETPAEKVSEKAKGNINRQIVDNIVYKDFVEDTTVKKPRQTTADAGTNTVTAETVSVNRVETSSAVKSAVTAEELEGNMPKKGSYTIQIAAGKSMEGSKKMAENLVKAGYPAQCIKEGNMYRVLIGSFKSREEAIQYGNSLQAKRAIKYFYPTFKK